MKYRLSSFLMKLDMEFKRCTCIVGPTCARTRSLDLETIVLEQIRAFSSSAMVPLEYNALRIKYEHLYSDMICMIFFKTLHNLLRQRHWILTSVHKGMDTIQIMSCLKRKKRMQSLKLSTDRILSKKHVYTYADVYISKKAYTYTYTYKQVFSFATQLRHIHINAHQHVNTKADMCSSHTKAHTHIHTYTFFFILETFYIRTFTHVQKHVRKNIYVCSNKKEYNYNIYTFSLTVDTTYTYTRIHIRTYTFSNSRHNLYTHPHTYTFSYSRHNFYRYTHTHTRTNT